MVSTINYRYSHDDNSPFCAVLRMKSESQVHRAHIDSFIGGNC